MSSPATAGSEQRREYHLEAQDLGTALRAIGRTSGREVIFESALVDGKRAPKIDGSFTPNEAIEALLKESGLVATYRNGAILIRGRSEPSDTELAGSTVRSGDVSLSNDILVTGSRIRGAQSPSPTLTISHEDMLNAGQNTLADAIRALPQASGAGQNPGIGQNVPESVGSYLGGASSINLRGLGSDATLTLLNGHRLSFNGAAQAIDISAIPLAAVDRVEIVTDGASALYGSDAVAGVANIILKRDYSGLDSTARFGASTDGGNEQQQYSLVGGKTWGSGGLMASYDFEKDTPVLARQRDYAAARSPGLFLYPALKHHSATLSAHQTLAPGLTLSVDGLFNERWTDRTYALSAAGNYLVRGNRTLYTSKSFTIAPSLTYELWRDWEVSISGVYGEDRTVFNSTGYTNGAVSSHTRSCYCNHAEGTELLARGSIFNLPGGSVKAAIGAGYRENGLASRDLISPSSQDIDATQRDAYGFAEITLPIITGENGLPFARRLILSGAVRYEDYKRIDTVFTPKVGAIYSPTSDIDLKVSWGKSFKAPTLYQLFSVKGASVYDIPVFGGTGFKPGTVGLYSGGGNPDLKPERATSWTATLSAHPRSVPGLSADLTYFSVDYRDRIVTPVTYITQALSNPIYADLITLNPTGADIVSALNGAQFFNNSSGAFDPAKVGAIIHSQYTNATRQHISGIDLSLRYRAWDGPLGSVTLSGNGSYIRSRQTLSALQPEVPLAGTLFNPPHFRGRAGVIWQTEQVTISPFINYIGGVDDQRNAAEYRVGSMTTLDLTGRVRLKPASRLLSGIDLTLSAQNLLNNKPSVITTTQVSQAPYDSANYSPAGRFISFTISKSW
ncbi:hypothetical protein AWL63_24265 (plasmid) [Sphingomonas panacis]|uniref:Secretin/TonB short N-terminal domain-containing protein n=1 Tax=Sphingomonas panacis TaxID=1560345 RepID=A0A1B3ZIL1_9SPHN|nr:TonB-dependent receptor [Sphingomonas panacis]AOH87268.1 hypothetical protein AWL63_24265 [Sphingomonas panacis]